MRTEEELQFAKRMGVLINGERVILGNTDTGEWIKISKECYGIIKAAAEQSYTYGEFRQVFDSKEDLAYMEDLIGKLEKLAIIGQETDFIKKPPHFITFAVTNRCNLKCKHCCVSAANEPDALNTKECQKIIDKIIALSPEQIIFTGGEPLLRNDIFTLLEYTRALFDKHIGLMTNGLLIDEENAERLAQLLDSIDISLDGADEKSCSEIRGSGVFAKVMKTIDRLKKEGFHNISLSMVVTKRNEKYVEQFKKLNNEMGTKPMLRSFSPIGRGKENRKDLELQRDNSGEEPSASDSAPVMKICSCGALKRTLYIDYQGNIYPCPVLLDKEYCFGSILDKDEPAKYFQEDMITQEESYRNFEGLYPQNYEECKDCNVNLFCWSCLHHIDLLKKGVISRKQNCKNRKMQLEKIIWGEDL